MNNSMLRSQHKSQRSRALPRHTEPKGDATNGKAHKGATICKGCMHILYRKSWMHPKHASHKTLEEANKSKTTTLCPACTMATRHLYEGEIVIQGVPEKFQMELTNLIHSYSRKAVDRDSQHRVLEFKKTSSTTYRITTSENQLAVRLAKKITEVFRGMINFYISHSREPYEIGRVRLAFI